MISLGPQRSPHRSSPALARRSIFERLFFPLFPPFIWRRQTGLRQRLAVIASLLVTGTSIVAGQSVAARAGSPVILLLCVITLKILKSDRIPTYLRVRRPLSLRACFVGTAVCHAKPKVTCGYQRKVGKKKLKPHLWQSLARKLVYDVWDRVQRKCGPAYLWQPLTFLNIIFS